MRPLNNFGELHVQEFGRTKVFPTFTCGHCTNVVVMREDRERPRKLCFSCQKWICEAKQICLAQCTPMHALADDRFENSGKYGILVPAIMAGATTVNEALESGLLAPGEL